MSAARAGPAEKARAATTDKTTFFIDPAPFRFDRLFNRSISRIALANRTRSCPPAHKSTCITGTIYLAEGLRRQAKNGGNCCLFRRFGPLATESVGLWRQSHIFRAQNTPVYRNPGRRRAIAPG